MKKCFPAFIILALLIGGCTSNEDENVKTSNWTDYSKASFMRECTQQTQLKNDSVRVKEMCNCVMQKMMKAYPDTNELHEMGRTKIAKESTAMVIKCLF